MKGDRGDGTFGPDKKTATELMELQAEQVLASEMEEGPLAQAQKRLPHGIDFYTDQNAKFEPILRGG